MNLMFLPDPAGNYMFKVNNRNTRTRRKICSKLTIKTPERRLYCWLWTCSTPCSSVSFVNFEKVNAGWGGTTLLKTRTHFNDWTLKYYTFYRQKTSFYNLKTLFWLNLWSCAGRNFLSENFLANLQRCSWVIQSWEGALKMFFIQKGK